MGVSTINGKAQRLAQFLDCSMVQSQWLAGYHVNWKTGQRDRPEPGGLESHTHCSAFVAAMAMRLGVYILRPPEHKQELLSNAQVQWLLNEGGGYGWRRLYGEAAAQEAANEGDLAVAAFQSPDSHKPGHIAIIRPSDKSPGALAAEGPQITQAGGHNYVSTSLQNGFTWRRWGVLFFTHAMAGP
jgi:hypothetical protein